MNTEKQINVEHLKIKVMETLYEEASAKINERLSELQQQAIENIWNYIFKLEQTHLTDYQKRYVNYISDEVKKIYDYNTERI